MKVVLSDSNLISIASIADLDELIPEGWQGEALNYGQGEGQIRVGECEWGFYFDDSGRQYFVLVEGSVELHDAYAMASGILARIQAKWGMGISGRVEGFMSKP